MTAEQTEHIASKADEPATGDGDQAGRAHNKTVWALITVATLILTVSAVNTWVERQLLDTDNWVDTSAVLIEDDQLRHELATFLVNQLYSSVDVGDALAARFPEDLSGLGGPLAAVLREPLVETVDVVLETQAVKDLWRDANRAVHSTAVAILEDDVAPGLSSARGEVTLDLGALVREVGAELGVSGDRLDQLPEDAGVVTIVESDTLEAAQLAVRAINLASVVLFLLVVGLYGLAIYLARGWRREATRNVGLATALSGFVLLLVVQLATGWIVDGAGTSSGQVVTSQVLPAATALLTRTAWAVVFFGLLIALFASLVGPSHAGQRVQRVTAAGFRRQAAAMWIGIALLVLLVLAWGPVSAPDNWWIMLLIVVLIGAGVEALRRTSLAMDGAESHTGAEGEPKAADDPETAVIPS